MDNTRIPFEAYKGEEPFIFVSYAHKDSDKVFPIISEFHKAGFPIWYDEGIDPGNEWPTEIANALLNCSLFIVFISSFSKESKNVVREINYALSKDKPFIHIWLEETTLNPGLDMQISTNQGIMLFRMEQENFYRKCRQTFEAFKIKKTNARAEPEEKRRQGGEASSPVEPPPPPPPRPEPSLQPRPSPPPRPPQPEKKGKKRGWLVFLIFMIIAALPLSLYYFGFRGLVSLISMIIVALLSWFFLFIMLSEGWRGF